MIDEGTSFEPQVTDRKSPAAGLGLTAIITTLNEEANIRDCLASVAFADRILVVDSFSTDRTVEIVREVPGVEVVQREYFGSAAQKNWAMDQVATPWLLIVDADERIPEKLAREIAAVIATNPPEDHFYIRRENVFIDRVIRHSGWSTDRVVRLIRRGTARYPNRRVHADLATEGPTPTLLSPMTHLTCRSLSQYLEKLHRYAAWGAADAYRQGRRAGVPELLVRPGWRFVRMYVVQGGFLDGLHGLVLCALQAWGVFLKWSRVWEWNRCRRNGLAVELPAYDESRETWEGRLS